MCGCEYEWNRLLYEEQVEECVEEFWCQWCEEDFGVIDRKWFIGSSDGF